MQKFSPIHVYGLTREGYYKATGIAPSEKIRFLNAEIETMELNMLQLRKWYRRRPFTSPEGRYMAKLIKHIEARVTEKKAKVKEILLNDSV